VGDCGNTVVAFIIFDVFFLIGSNILLNLFVAVLLESFFNFQVQVLETLIALSSFDTR
jgi:hypothetical protein